MQKTRGPGRPRKLKIRSGKNKHGIVKEPTNKDSPESEQNVMEFVYDNPMMLKKIFNLFKSLNVSQIDIEFKHDGLEIITNDRVERTSIFVQIHGVELNRYYCESEFIISIDPQETERIFQSLDEEYSSICFISKRFSYKHKISIIMHQNNPSSDTIYEVDIVQVESAQNNIQELLEKSKSYPIGFTLDSKFFKKYIANASILTASFSIEKHGLDPLCFVYHSTKGKISNKRIFNDEKKIKLISNIKEDEIFAASVFITFIKPISSSLISNSLEIKADTINPLLITAYLDQVYNADSGENNSQSCTIKIFTELMKFN